MLSRFSNQLAVYSKRIMLTLMIGVCCVCSVQSALELSAELIERIKVKYGDQAVSRIEQWKNMMKASQGLSDQEKLQRVNHFFNSSIHFVDDIYLWDLIDYWATPIEFLAVGKGDCEDYSIAKYFTLLELGVAEEKMRITYVKALNQNQAHMVLTYYETPRSAPLVLDNLIPEIKIATQRTDLIPVYSFNGSGLWLAKTRGSGKKVGESSRLSLWNELKKRMMHQVF